MKRLIITYTSLIAILIFVMWLVGSFFTPQTAVASVQFTISPGDGAFSVARNLTKEGILHSPFLFLVYAFFSGNYSHFQPGTYLLKQPLSIGSIIKTITSKPTEVSVVIIPGMTLKEIDSALANAGVIVPGSLSDLKPAELKGSYYFLGDADSLEGFLLPDTYNFFLASSPQSAAKIMLDNFSKKAWPRLSQSSDYYKTLIVASLLEKEVVSLRDKEMVSGIIENRLKIGMPLQIDATVIYAACGGRFLNCAPLTPSDFSVRSPYNTYKIKGLPPTPIGSPTVDSIDAALSPISSQYLYYLSDSKTQKTIFSKTLEGHSINRQQYLGL